MRRSLATRIFAAAMAAWFGIVTIQPLYGQPCPHHLPALAALAEGLGMGSAPHAMIHGSMNVGLEHTAPGAHGHHGSGGDHGCQCLGACCGTAPLPLAQQPETWVPVPASTRISVTKSAPIARGTPAAPPHSRPFATAPPATLLA